MKDGTVVVAVSTEKGAYFLKSGEGRRKWKLGKQFLPEESVNNVAKDNDGHLYAATLTEGVFRSKDDGKSWKPSNKGLHVRKVWTVEADKHQDGLLYAGTQYGHLFRSFDSAKSWEEVTGLYTAPNRENWGIDWGFGTTGLTVHTIKSDPHKKGRVYVIAAGNGAYKTEDGGETWKSLKSGITSSCPLVRDDSKPSIPTEKDKNEAEEHLKMVHSCAHKLAISNSKPGVVYQQNHCGVYRSSNFGDSWSDISPSNSTRHGFPIVLVEGKRQSLFTIPAYQGECKKHNSCIKGQLAVYRTYDEGKTWKSVTKGLPKEVHTVVLRDSFSKDSLKEPGLYFGTTVGDVYWSTDLGESWNLIASGLGRIQGVSAFAV